MAWRGQRARNLGLIGDYASDYFSESSAESERSNWESEEDGDSGAARDVDPGDRVGRSKMRAPPRYPRPHSHLLRKRDGQRARGNKHSRRWENSVFISTLYQLPEEEVRKGYSILPEHCSSFTKLHTDHTCMQVWQEFSSFPEEEQGAILGGNWRGPIQGGRGVGRKGSSVEDRYSCIDRHIRNMLKHNKHLPHDFLHAMEAELTDYFMADHCALVVGIHHNTFYRLLVHGLCQYLGLTSTTSGPEFKATRPPPNAASPTLIQHLPPDLPPSQLAHHLPP